MALVWEILWTGNAIPGKVIVLLVVALFLRTVLVAHRQVVRYRREQESLRRVAERLREWRRQQTAAQAARPAAEPAADDGEQAAEAESLGDLRVVDPAQLGEGIDARSLIGERLAAIGTLRGHRVRVSPETLQQLTTAREEATPGVDWPAFAGGMAMLLGLLGTFIGLAMVVQQIHLRLPAAGAEVTVEAWMQSIAEIRSVLVGLKTAFSTSLVGMACAVYAAACGYRLERARAACREALERFTAQELLPATVPAVADENLLERVSLQLERSFAALEEVFAQNREALAELSGVQKAFLEIVEQIRAITRSEASRDFDAVIGELAGANRALLAVTHLLPRLAESVREGQQGVVRSLEELAGRMGRALAPAAPRLLGRAGAAIGLLVAALLALDLVEKLVAR